MAITINEAKKLAKLSRLEFSEDELYQFINEFESTLKEVEKIFKVNVDNINMIESTLNADDELRTDEVRLGFTNEKAIMNAPDSKDGAFLVPVTVDSE